MTFAESNRTNAKPPIPPLTEPTPHTYGLPGAHNPAMHIRQLPAGDLFDTYMTSFEYVWATATEDDGNGTNRLLP